MHSDWNWRSLQPSDFRTEQIYFGLCVVFLVGLFFSRALISISPVLLLILALTSRGFKKRRKLLKKNRSALSLLALYGLLVISFIYTEDTRSWLEQIHRYIALLLVPLAGGLLPPLREKKIYVLLYLFTLLTTVFTLGTMGQYLSNIAVQNQLIYYSRNPPPINQLFHIHFGVMMTLAIFFGMHIFRSPVGRWRNLEKYLALTCVLILLVSMHVLAYRTGLLALYVTLAFMIYSFIKNQKRYLLGGALIALLLIVPVIAYSSLESLRLRVGNTRYDVARYLEHRDINYYSVSQRLAAWETAFAVIKRHWLIGVGPADILREMQRQYTIQDFGLEKINQVMIHNQYLHILMGSGIIGLILFLNVFIYSFRRLAWPKDFGATAFLVTSGAVMLVDSFFELQRGLNLFVFFYLLLLIQKEQGSIMQAEQLKAEQNNRCY